MAAASTPSLSQSSRSSSQDSGGTGKASGTAVGYRVEQAAVAGLQQDVQYHFFGDRVADLDGSAGKRFRFAGQFRTAERRAVDTVASGSSADRDDQVVRFDGLFLHPDRNHPDVAAVN